MKNRRNKMTVTGLHILGEIYATNNKRLKSLTETKSHISKIIKKHHLKELGSFYYQFQESGFTGIVSLVESHIAIHTWPEFGYLTLDVYLCNYSRNNNSTCKKVFNEIGRIFKPNKITKRLIRR